VSNTAVSRADAPGAIEIRTSFFPLAFLLFLFPTRVTIDGGAEISHPWGPQVYPVPAGRHQVRVWCPYLGFIKMGDTTNAVDVMPGQVSGFDWKAPWLTFLPARWIPLGLRPLAPGELAAGATPPSPAPGPTPAPAMAAGPPAGWHPDPHGQAALRYWDGQRWTEHLSGP
jgi:hypothetical protein